MKKIVLAIPILFLILFGCRKEVDKEYPEFVGYWVCTDNYNAYYITIDGNSSATFDGYKADGTTIVAQGTARANKRSLKIKNHSFRIEQYPQLIDTTSAQDKVYIMTDYEQSHGIRANLKMTLKDISMSKNIGTNTFYKADY